MQGDGNPTGYVLLWQRACEPPPKRVNVGYQSRRSETRLSGPHAVLAI